MMRNLMDSQIKRELIELALLRSNEAEYEFSSGGWFREFSCFFDLYVGYGEL